MIYNNTVSIIIPVFNEEKYIEKCLDSIINQTYNNITEILILDGMSTDATRSIVSKYTESCNKIRLIDNNARIQSAALNIGITSAKGDIIVRVDAHAIYDENYVYNCVHHLNETKSENVANVGGPTYLVTSGKYVADSIVFLHESKFGIGVAKFRQKDFEGYVDTVWNGAFWRSVFENVGLYNESLTRSEDNDMNNRITKKGYKIYQSKDIIAYYHPRTTIKQVLLQNYANGKAIGNSIVSNSEIIRIRHLVPLGFVMSILFFGALWKVNVVFKFAEIFILLSYFTLAIIEGIKIGCKNGFKYAPIMIIMFFLLHVAYGIGTIVGFFSELKKNIVKK